MNTPDFSGLKTMYVNCTLKRSPETSHTQGLMDVSAHIMKKECFFYDLQPAAPGKNAKRKQRISAAWKFGERVTK